MDFTDKIDRHLLRTNFAAASKEEALRKITAIAAQSALLRGIPEKEIFDRLNEREAAVSTGIGDGVAIPHARFPALTDFLVFVLVAPRGVPFDALDGQKVRVLFVVLAPESQVGDHVKLLASISRLLAQVQIKREILHTTSTEVLHEVLTRRNGGARSVVPPTDRKRLLVLVLHYQEDVQAMLEFLLDQGIEGATVVPCQGMGAYISNIPLFASFLGFMQEDRNESFLILALIPTSAEERLLHGIEAMRGDLDKVQGIMVMTLDVALQKGTMKML